MNRFLLAVICVFISLNLTYSQWIKTNGEALGGSINCFAFSGTNLFCGDGGIFLSTDNGTNWAMVDVGLVTGGVNAFVVSGTHLYAATNGRGVLISTNNGITWDNSYNHVLRLYSVSSLALSGTNLFAGTYDHGVFLSTNNGTNWVTKNANLTDSVVTALFVNEIILLAATTSGVFISTDKGNDWHSSVLTNTHIRSFVGSGMNLFACAEDSGVFLSTDNGTSWRVVNSGLTNISVTALALSDSNLFAGTFGEGVFLSTDKGTSWNNVSIGLDTAAHFVLSLAVIGTNLFAGMYGGGGVWRRPINEMVTAVDETKSKIPNKFALLQNYPNPFNPSTMITYTVGKRANVLLKIVDILGRDIKTIVNEQKSPGTYNVQWNAKDQASGIYFCKLTNGSYNTVKKLLLMK